MSIQHVIDPRGEVVLIVRNSNPPFAIWTEQTTPTTMSQDGNNTNTEPAVEASAASLPEPDIADDDQDGVRIQVSAKHLTFGSPVFDRMLNGEWDESREFKDKGSIELEVGSWDVDAFLAVLYVIHAQLSKLPQTVTLEMLAKIAVVSEYYDIQEVKFFCDMWLGRLLPVIPNHCADHSRNVLLWLWVSYFAQHPQHFAKCSSIAMEGSKEPISSLGLPIPARIIDEMNRRRTETIQSTLNLWYSRRNTLLGIIDDAKEEDGSQCTLECAGITLGHISKNMRALGMLSPRPPAPFYGVKNNSFYMFSNGLHRPYWAERSLSLTKLKQHTCRTSSGYPSMFHNLYKRINPLSLSDYIPTV